MRSADEESYCEFVGSRRRKLLRTAFLFTGEWHQAEDLVQIALAKLYLAWPKVQRRGEVDAYARRTLLNAYLDERRRPWRREQSTDPVPDAVDANSSSDGHDPYLRQQLLAALAETPPRQRATLVLRFWEDLSVDQVADILNCSTGNVKSQTARGLERLRDVLGTEALTAMKELS